MPPLYDPRAMDAALYLARIGYDGPLAPTAPVLRELHRRHLFSVPFENLDIHIGRPIVVDENAFVRKIVGERRGGFCYELNGAFAALLRAIGFDVELLSAGVANDAGAFGPEYDHLALRVTIDGERWLADVGFGDNFLEPLRYDDRDVQQDPVGDFRLEDRDGAVVLQRLADGAWKDEYRFLPVARELAEFAGMCHWQQTAAESPFTKRRICSVATPNGRVSLANLKLIVTENGVRTESEVASEEAWREALQKRFGVRISPLP